MNHPAKNVSPQEADLLESGDGLCGVDQEQRIVLWNRAAEALLGYAPAEVLGRHCFGVLGTTDSTGRRNCKARCAHFIRALRRQTAAACTLRSQTKAGKSIWLSVSSVLPPVSSNNGVVLVHLFNDVTQLKTLEVGLRQLLEAGAAASESSAALRPPDCELPAIIRLTPREREVISLLASGTGTRKIAVTLGTSVATVRNHISNVFVKLHVHSRLEAVAFANQNELL